MWRLAQAVLEMLTMMLTLMDGPNARGRHIEWLVRWCCETAAAGSWESCKYCTYHVTYCYYNPMHAFSNARATL